MRGWKPDSWNSRLTLPLVLTGVLLTSCTISPPSHDRGGDSQGIVKGSLTVNGKAEELRYVYARQLPLEEGTAAHTRVVLSEGALTDEVFGQIASDHWGGGAVGGVVVDIGTDSKWNARFMTAFGLQDTYGFTSSGGDVKVESGRARGRIALSNQSDTGIRAFRVSFNVPLEARQVDLTKNQQKQLMDRWRIDDWRGSKGEKYVGEMEFVRRGKRLIANATIRYEKNEPITETFDVVTDGDRVKLFGIVDPDARWIADNLDLKLDGDVLSGVGIDDQGNAASVRFRRDR